MRSRNLNGTVHEPGSDGYAEAATPFNSAAVQRPALVARVADAEDVAACVRAASADGLRIKVQATGHSAAGELGDDVLLIDTQDLDTVQIDAGGKTARVGAGVRWGDVQPAAESHGLLGLSGSTPLVGVAGYTFGGGVGWLVRPFGMASARLREVAYVDGRGTLRTAREDAEDPTDVEALWAFRGGGGVGIATRLELELVPVGGLWAGFMLWPAASVAEVAAAWAEALPQLGPSVSSALGVLKLPPTPDIPEDLHHRPVVRVLLAGCGDAPDVPHARALFGALPSPLLDTLGPANADRLGAIHLDPPVPVPGVGDGRWLTGAAIAGAADILGACGTGDDFPFGELELRHVETQPAAVLGAMTEPVAPILTHAVGEPSTATDEALARVMAAMSPYDLGRRSAGFCDGFARVPDAFDTATRDRLQVLHTAVDPDELIIRPAGAA